MDSGGPSSKRSLDEWMLVREVSNRELAQAIGVSRESLINWANGRTKPRNTAFERLCQELQITPDQIDLAPADYRKSEEHRTKLSLAMRANKLRKEERVQDERLVAS